MLHNKMILSRISAAEVYSNFYYTCGDSITSGVLCRHFYASHKTISAVAFCIGALHKRWIPSTSLNIYDVVTADGVVGNTPRVESAALCTARVMYHATQMLIDVPLDVLKQSRLCYGKLWGLCRKVTSAITVDSIHVHHAEFEDLVGILERILKQVQNRAEINTAPDEE